MVKKIKTKFLQIPVHLSFAFIIYLSVFLSVLSIHPSLLGTRWKNFLFRNFCTRLISILWYRFITLTCHHLCDKFYLSSASNQYFWYIWPDKVARRSRHDWGHKTWDCGWILRIHGETFNFRSVVITRLAVDEGRMDGERDRWREGGVNGGIEKDGGSIVECLFWVWEVVGLFQAIAYQKCKQWKMG